MYNIQLFFMNAKNFFFFKECSLINNVPHAFTSHWRVLHALMKYEWLEFNSTFQLPERIQTPIGKGSTLVIFLHERIRCKSKPSIHFSLEKN